MKSHPMFVSLLKKGARGNGQIFHSNIIQAMTASQVCYSCTSWSTLSSSLKTLSSKPCVGNHHRAFSSSPNLQVFWRRAKNKFPSSPEVVATFPQHDGKTLVDRFLFVKTLDNFYFDVPDGIILDTAYADSRPGEAFNSSIPIVLGIHDTPGSHKDLVPLLTTFAKLGCRTIAPTLPGHGNTRGLMKGFDDVFSQSTIEKAMFIEDFLADLEIPRVDMVVAVGAGCYPALRLCAGGDTMTKYKSMGLISPWPYKRPRFQPSPELTRRISEMWDRPFLRGPARLLLAAYKCGEITDPRDKLTTAYLLYHLDLPESMGLAMAISSMNIPRVVVFGEEDECVEKELYYDVLNSLEIPESHVSIFKDKLVSPPLPGAVVFPNEGYDLQMKHPGLISAFLLPLVQISYPHIRI